MNHNLKMKIRNVCNRQSVLKDIYSYLGNKRAYSLLDNMDDAEFAKMKYKEETGRDLDLKNPQTFFEKLSWLKVYNRDPLMTRCADKVAVRDYVRECGLDHILNEVYAVYDSADEIDFENVPDRCFFKCNHGSGLNIIFDRNKPFDEKRFRREFNKSLKTNYYVLTREWQYKDIKPKIICERVLEDKNGNFPLDFRFFCFDGEPKFFTIEIGMCDKEGRHSRDFYRNFYDVNFNFLNMRQTVGNYSHRIPKPHNFQEMVECAKVLSAPFVHARVDFLSVLEEFYFGEITFFTGGGNRVFNPYSFDLEMGKYIDLNSDKVVLGEN